NKNSISMMEDQKMNHPEGTGKFCNYGCGCGWGHGHRAFRVLIVLIIIVIAFWIGVRVGEVRVLLGGYEGFNHGFYGGYGYPTQMMYGGQGGYGAVPGGMMPIRGGTTTPGQTPTGR